VKAAEDAFGVTIGRETLGLYTTTNVRGFSPTAAGNARIDGLYFDQVWPLNSRVRRATTIRVGPSAQSYPFPAPTGIVDQSFRIPGKEPARSLLVSADEWGGMGFEADAVVRVVRDRLSLGLGAAVLDEEYSNGTDGKYRNAGASLRWTPSSTLEIVPFAVRSEGRDDEAGPTYVPAGPYLPRRIERRQFDGPSWVDNEGPATNYGVLASYLPNSEWRVRLGAFRSRLGFDPGYAHLLVNLQPDSSAQRLIVADPPKETASTSGELRITRSVSDGDRLHLIHVSLRARDRTRSYGGSDTLDLGPARPGEAVTVPKPAFEFGPQSHDEVTQQTAGVAYELRWARRGELGIGVQRSSYSKRVERPDSPVAATSDEPWLYNVAGAWALSDSLTVYASHTRGLEESGVAPDVAVNRGEALPAIHTRQSDAGVRYAFGPSLRLLAGVFEVEKPYFTVDATNRFAALGDVMHRGIEVSLSGKPRAGLDIVAGAVLMDPEVEGPDVASGAVGRRPIAQPKRTLLANLEWRPVATANVSFDVAVRHVSRAMATRDNLVELPSRTLVDLGGRYRFAIGRARATLRVSLTNVTDEYAYQSEGSGAYSFIPGRRASAYVVVDW
jgi:iron complex outermembrane receptor protein